MSHPLLVDPVREQGLAVYEYPVRPLLSCENCQQAFFGTTLGDGTPGYRSRCGCRLHPLPAREVEHRIYAHTLHRVYEGGGALLCDCLPLIAERLFTTVALGTTTDDITYVPRT